MLTVVVYSVGEDGEDNGGKGDFAADTWKTGLDFCITFPPQEEQKPADNGS